MSERQQPDITADNGLNIIKAVELGFSVSILTKCCKKNDTRVNRAAGLSRTVGKKKAALMVKSARALVDYRVSNKPGLKAEDDWEQSKISHSRLTT